MFQLDASLMSALLCLTSISVFLHINFLLKTAAMSAAAVAHVVVYFAYVGPRSAAPAAAAAAAGEGFQYQHDDETR